MLKFFYLFLFIPLVGCSILGMDRTPEPEYIVILNEEIDNNIFEIRDYKQLTIAETIVENTDFDKMSGIAFKRLGGYIFGDNQKEEEIQMTAPVLLDRKPETWKMIFVLPKKYSIENAPAPKNQNVVIKTMKEKRFAVIQFSGSLEEKKFDEHLEKLREWIKSKNYEILSDPLFAGYNHPWTIPFLRRNEVLIEVSK